uniref:Uncharacterized protein n=1 Tax=uncultured organism TaxID=155900 RepID=A0A7L9QCG7_9ZZZZ|nr:hypothetical protein [uncultured organism]
MPFLESAERRERRLAHRAASKTRYRERSAELAERRAEINAFTDRAASKRAAVKAERVALFNASQALIVCTQCHTAGHVRSTFVKRRTIFLRKIRYRVMHCGLCGMSYTVR